MEISLKFLLLFGLLGALRPEQGLAAATGKSAAMKYFSKKAKQPRLSSRAPASAAVTGQGLLGLAVGSLINSKSYGWVDEELTGWNMEVSYLRAGRGTFAQGFHLELQKFGAQGQDLTKLAFLLSFNFPRRLSFPVYIGVSAGPSFFLEQKDEESEFALDYKAYLGLRLNEAHSQYFIQSGVKNHVHVLSDGQFVGWFVSSGVAYKF